MCFLSPSVSALVGLDVRDQLVLRVVGKSSEGLSHELRLHFVRDGRRPGHDPQSEHVLAIARVDDRVVVVVGVDDHVVGLIGPVDEGREEPDVALARSLIGGALGLTMDAEAGDPVPAAVA